MTDVIKLSGISVSLPCGHQCEFSKKNLPCEICSGNSITFPPVNGFEDTKLDDEDDKLRIQIHLLAEKLNLFKSFLELDTFGKLEIHVIDKTKQIDRALTPQEIHKVHSELSERKIQYETVAKAGRSALKALIDDDYRKDYINNLGQVKKISLKLGKTFIKKATVSIGTVIVGFIVAMFFA